MRTGQSIEPRWPDPTTPDIDAACAVCGAGGPHPAAVSIDNLFAAETLHFLRCRACGSLTATGSRLFTYTDDGGHGPVTGAITRGRHRIHGRAVDPGTGTACRCSMSAAASATPRLLAAYRRRAGGWP